MTREGRFDDCESGVEFCFGWLGRSAFGGFSEPSSQSPVATCTERNRSARERHAHAPKSSVRAAPCVRRRRATATISLRPAAIGDAGSSRSSYYDDGGGYDDDGDAMRMLVKVLGD